MPAAPVTLPTDPVAATRRKLARLLAVGAMRAAGEAQEEAGARQGQGKKREVEVEAA